MQTTTLTTVYGAILTAALAITITRARRTQALTVERLAAERAAGYRQGLLHAAAGLLDAPTSTRVDAGHNTERRQQ